MRIRGEPKTPSILKAISKYNRKAYVWCIVILQCAVNPVLCHREKSACTLLKTGPDPYCVLSEAGTWLCLPMHQKRHPVPRSHSRWLHTASCA